MTQAYHQTRFFVKLSKPNFEHLKQTHVWGCPTYVLEPAIQDGRKLPKWQPKSQRGVFLGFSERHFSQIGLIKNLCTGAVSPQYHVVYNDNFTTVTNSDKNGIHFHQQLKDWENLVKTSSEQYWDFNDPNLPQPLSQEWNDTIIENSQFQPPQPSTAPCSILCPSSTRSPPCRSTTADLNNEFNLEHKPVEQPSDSLDPTPESQRPTSPLHHDQPSPPLQRSTRTCKQPERYSKTKHSTLSVVKLTSKKFA